MDPVFLFLPSRSTGTTRHRIPRNGRHGRGADGRRRKQGWMRGRWDSEGDGREEGPANGVGEKAYSLMDQKKRCLGASDELGPATNQVVMQ
ncbi:hypothetical protein COCMIDRAFT_86044 [Bipolaris oryzae ATCC 44560]|uniref:Uncharacterized protein n=1 Tax=Bipolaris oryzae ATCC 44560 TaxID=930090 RepID=W6ZN26_COCMI|nr:uncharacterized protein COCMIDRAFT_86044 [Bipolaris oryzae ATCC 44560]EUC48899.1 hypothetical protein COCMIDRAFT_86044 [Bipolaris oryzae ATCC 44560]